MDIRQIVGAISFMTRSCVFALGALLCVTALRVSADHVISADTVLTEDTDWSADGTVVIEEGAVLDLNGHRLIIAGLSGGGMLTNSVAGYVTVPYIQSSGTQYIDTGYKHDATTVVDLKAQFPTVPAQGKWFTVYGSREKVKSVNQFGVTMNNTTGSNPRHYFITGSTEVQTDIAVEIDTDYIYHLEKNGESTLNSQVIATSTGGSAGYTDYIFCNHSIGKAIDLATMRLYYCQIYSDETLVRDFVPALRRADGTLGLLDRVNHVFYTNVGSGVFTTDPGSIVTGLDGLVLTHPAGAVYDTASLTVAADVAATLTLAGSLSADEDLSCFGTLEIAEGAVLDLNGHQLTVAGLTGGGMLTNSVSAYVILPYIQSSGTQYIDTSYQHDATTVVDLKAQFPTVPAKSKWFTVYGSRESIKSVNQFGVTMNNTTGSNPRHYFITGNVEVQTDIAVEVDTDYVYHLVKNGQSTLNSQVIATSTGGCAGYNDYIFCNHSIGNPTDYATMRLYYCQIHSGEKLVRDFVPAQRRADGALGLLDRVHNVFYPNAGTGTFTSDPEFVVEGISGIVMRHVSGAVYDTSSLTIAEDVIATSQSGSLTADTDWRGFGAVIIPSDTKVDLSTYRLSVSGLSGRGEITASHVYEQLAYIQSSGTQYIDTGYQHDATTVVDLKAQFPSVPAKGKWFTVYGGREGYRTANQFGATMNNSTGSNPRHYFITGSTEVQTEIAVETNTDYIYHLVKNGTSTLNSQAVATSTGGCAGYNDYIFCNDHIGTPSDYATMRLYYCQIYSGETLVRNFVPAKRISDSKVGLFDPVTHVFYENRGTGTFAAGAAVSGSVLNGELHIDVPAGKEVNNNTVLISGKVRVVKDGEGLLIASRYPQTYAGGTDIVAGTLKAGSYNINRQSGKSFFGSWMTLDVRAGGTLDPNGGCWWGNHTVRLYGGCIHNTALSPSEAFNCYINLYADSSFITDVTYNYGSVMSLNGHTLTVTIADDAVWHTWGTYKNGQVVVQGGTFQTRDSQLTATDCSFDISSKTEIKYAFTADDLILRNDQGTGANTASITVSGTFTPVGGYFPDITLQNGSSLDLSAKEGPWSSVSRNGCTLSFADNASVTFLLGTRKIVNPQIVSWIEMPAGASTLTPLCDQEKTVLAVRAHGIYVASPGMFILVR